MLEEPLLFVAVTLTTYVPARISSLGMVKFTDVLLTFKTCELCISMLYCPSPIMMNGVISTLVMGRPLF